MGPRLRPLAEVDHEGGQGTGDTGPAEDAVTFTFYSESPLIMKNWERIGMIVDHIKTDHDPNTNEDDGMSDEEYEQFDDEREEEEQAEQEEREWDKLIQLLARQFADHSGYKASDYKGRDDREELVEDQVYGEWEDWEKIEDTYGRERGIVERWLRFIIEYGTDDLEAMMDYEMTEGEEPRPDPPQYTPADGTESIGSADFAKFLSCLNTYMAHVTGNTNYKIDAEWLFIILSWVEEDKKRKESYKDASDGAEEAVDALDYTEEDPKFGRFKCMPMKWFRNGFFQHLVWLGVHGWLDINYYDKEILLHDPWPSYNELPVGGYDGPFARGTGEGWEMRGDVIGVGNVCESLFDFVGLDEQDGRDEEGEGVARQEALANFLRKGVVEGFSIPGILISHDHFDHSDDIPYILELLLMEQGVGRTNLGLEFNLNSPPLEIDQMPKIYGDYYTIKYISERIEKLSDYRMRIISHIQSALDEAGFSLEDTIEMAGGAGDDEQEDDTGTRVREGLQSLLTSSMWTSTESEAWETVKAHYGSMDSDKYVEVMAEDGSRLNYSAYQNEQLAEAGETSSMQKCGVPCQEFDVGHFHVKPYVWDHSKMGGPCGERGHRKLGAYGRCTAYLVHHKDVENAKKTFFIGSGGPMHPAYSARRDSPDHVQDLDSPIECDVLIDAIVPQEDPVLFALSNAQIAASPPDPDDDDYAYAQVKPLTKLDASLKYQMKNVKVNDFVIASHWEDFDYFLLGGSSSSEEFASGAEGTSGVGMGIPGLLGALVMGMSFYHFYGGDFVKVVDYIKAREKYFGPEDAKKIFILGRVGFEWELPLSPNELRTEIWSDPLIRDFEEEGPYKDTPEHLAAIGLCIKDIIAKKREPWDIVGELGRLPSFSFVISAFAGMAGLALIIIEMGKAKYEDGEGYVGREDYDSSGEFMGAFRRIVRKFVGYGGGDGFI